MSDKKSRDKFRRHESIIIGAYFVYLSIQLINLITRYIDYVGSHDLGEIDEISYYVGDALSKVPFLIVGPFFYCMMRGRYHYEF